MRERIRINLIHPRDRNRVLYPVYSHMPLLNWFSRFLPFFHLLISEGMDTFLLGALQAFLDGKYGAF